MNHTDERDLLARALRERAGDVDGHPIGMAAVRSSARRIRRRRAVVAGAVAAVAAGVALPAGLAVVSPGTGPSYGPAQAPSASAPSPELPSATPRADGTYRLTLTGAPVGADPRESYVLVEEKALVTPEGRQELPELYSQLVPYRDGWLGLYGGENGYENVVLEDDLQVVERSPGGGAIVLNGDGSRVLTVVRDFNVQGRAVVADSPTGTAYEREQVTWDLPANMPEDWQSSARPIGYVDERTVVWSETGDAGPVAFLGTDGDEGARKTHLDRFLAVASASDANGLVAGQVSYDNTTGGSCWGVVDPDRSLTELVWRTCDHSLGAFSPDGRFVVAGPPQYDAWGPAGLSILDARNGEPLVELSPDGRTAFGVTQAMWEDEDTVLAAVVEGDRMGIVRVELNGHVERATETYPMRDMSLRLWLAQVPH